MLEKLSKYFKWYEFILMFSLILVDQLIKLVLDNNVDLNNILFSSKLFSITKLYNYGVSFSILENKTIIILIITMIALIFLVKIKRTYKSIGINIGITLILSGAFGNLIDRIMYSYVIDYIKINLFNFPIFNLADMLITLGFIVILLTEGYYSYKIKREKNGK